MAALLQRLVELLQQAETTPYLAQSPQMAVAAGQVSITLALLQMRAVVVPAAVVLVVCQAQASVAGQETHLRQVHPKETMAVVELTPEEPAHQPVGVAEQVPLVQLCQMTQHRAREETEPPLQFQAVVSLMRAVVAEADTPQVVNRVPLAEQAAAEMAAPQESALMELQTPVAAVAVAHLLIPAILRVAQAAPVS